MGSRRRLGGVRPYGAPGAVGAVVTPGARRERARLAPRAPPCPGPPPRQRERPLGTHSGEPRARQQQPNAWTASCSRGAAARKRRALVTDSGRG